jgi:hypothetical protein
MWLKIKPLTKYIWGILCPLPLNRKINGISEYLKSILETLKGLQRKIYPVFSIMYNVPTRLYDFVRAYLLNKEKHFAQLVCARLFKWLSKFPSASYFLPNKNHTCGTSTCTVVTVYVHATLIARKL